MSKIPAILVNYNFQPNDWWLDYDLEATIFDRSDDGIEREFNGKTYKTKNWGDVDYDKLSYIVENYDNLPEVFVWGKTNMEKYVDMDLLKKALKTKQFTPLLKLDHKTYSDKYGVVCRYNGEIYEERADSWFFNNPDLASRVDSWSEWCDLFGLPKTQFIPFAPGGNYILTREAVHRYSVDFYNQMRSLLPYAQHPAEAHACERSYYLMWK